MFDSQMYVVNYTCPEMTYVVNKVSWFTSNREKYHWKMIGRVPIYLRYALNYVLHHIRYPILLKEFIDANWIYDTKDTKSTRGYVFIIGSKVLSCKSENKK